MVRHGENVLSVVEFVFLTSIQLLVSIVYVLTGATVNTTVLERDPAPFFFNPEVQILLKKLTGFDMKTIFRTEPRPKFETPRYVFMTEEQLNKVGVFINCIFCHIVYEGI